MAVGRYHRAHAASSYVYFVSPSPTTPLRTLFLFLLLRLLAVRLARHSPFFSIFLSTVRSSCSFPFILLFTVSLYTLLPFGAICRGHEKKSGNSASIGNPTGRASTYIGDALEGVLRRDAKSFLSRVFPIDRENKKFRTFCKHFFVHGHSQFFFFAQYFYFFLSN